MSGTSRIINFTARIRLVLERKLKPYSCRKSKQTYKQHQLAAIWCLMKYLRTDYRGVVELVGEMPRIGEALQLTQPPHFTTVNKFFLRTSDSWFYATLIESRALVQPTIVAIDATGFSQTNASRHYIRRIFGGSWSNDFTKLSLAVDTDSPFVLACRAGPGRRHDVVDFEPLVQETVANGMVVVADKGYDSEQNHRLARRLSAASLIPVRTNKYGTTNGFWRKKMLKTTDWTPYRRRPLVETVNSVMKRLLGSFVCSRLLENQCKELVLMCVVYNCHRSLRLLLRIISTKPSVCHPWNDPVGMAKNRVPFDKCMVCCQVAGFHRLQDVKESVLSPDISFFHDDVRKGNAFRCNQAPCEIGVEGRPYLMIDKHGNCRAFQHRAVVGAVNPIVRNGSRRKLVRNVVQRSIPVSYRKLLYPSGDCTVFVPEGDHDLCHGSRVWRKG